MSSKKVTPRSLIHGVLDTNSISKSTTRASRTERRRSSRKSLSSATPGTLIKGVLQTSSTAKKSPTRERRVKPTPPPPPSSSKLARAARRSSSGLNPTPRGLIQGYLAATTPETPAVRVDRIPSEEGLGQNVETESYQAQFAQFISPDLAAPDDVIPSQGARTRRGTKRQRQPFVAPAISSGVSRRVQEVSSMSSFSDSAVASPTLHSIPEEVEAGQVAQIRNEAPSQSQSDDDEYEDLAQLATQPQRPAGPETVNVQSQFEIAESSIISMSQTSLQAVAAADTFQIHQEENEDSPHPESQSSGEDRGPVSSQSEDEQTSQSHDEHPSPKRARRTGGDERVDKTSREYSGITRRSSSRKLDDSSRGGVGSTSGDEGHSESLMTEDEEQLPRDKANREESVDGSRSRHSRAATPRSSRKQSSRKEQDGESLAGIRRSPRKRSMVRVSPDRNEGDSLISEDERLPENEVNAEESVQHNRSQSSRAVTPGSSSKQNSRTEQACESLAGTRRSPGKHSTIKVSPIQNGDDSPMSADEQLSSDEVNAEGSVRGNQTHSSRGATPGSSREQTSKSMRASDSLTRNRRSPRKHSTIGLSPIQNEDDSLISADEQLSSNEVNAEGSVRGNQTRSSRGATPGSSREQTSKSMRASESLARNRRSPRKHSAIEVSPIQNEDDSPMSEDEHLSSNEVNAGGSLRGNQTRSSRDATPGSSREQTSKSMLASESLARNRRSPRKHSAIEVSPIQNEDNSPMSEDEQLSSNEVNAGGSLRGNQTRSSRGATPGSSREQTSKSMRASESLARNRRSPRKHSSIGLSPIQNEGDRVVSEDEAQPSTSEGNQGEVDGQDRSEGSRRRTPHSVGRWVPEKDKHQEALENVAGHSRRSEMKVSQAEVATGVGSWDSARDVTARNGAPSRGTATRTGEEGRDEMVGASQELAEYLERSTESPSAEDAGESEGETSDGYSPLVTPDMLPTGRKKTPAPKTPAVLKERNKSTRTPAVSRQKAAPPRRKARPKRNHILPLNLTKSIFTHFCNGRVSRDAWDAIEDCSEEFFDGLCDDLARYCNRAKRKTIQMEDVIRLMKRQGHVSNMQSLHALIEKYLSMEYRRELIPCAQAGGGVMPPEELWID